MSRLLPALPHALIALGVFLLLGLIALIGSRGRPVASPSGITVLFRHNLLFRGFANCSTFGITVGLAWLTFLYPPRGPEVWYILALYVFFAAFTLPLVWEASRFFVLVTPDGLTARSAWRGRRTIAWEDFSEVSFSPLNAWFVFRSTNGDTIRAHAFVAGLKELVRLVESRAPVRSLKKARIGYERLGLPFPELNDEPILEARAPRRPGEW